MKARLAIPALSMILVTGLALGIQASRNGDDKEKEGGIRWVNFEEGLELARKEKRMLLVDVYTDWCHWCKVMDEKTYGNRAVIDYANKNIVMAKLNAETKEKFSYKGVKYSGSELAMMFGVSGFPTTLFLEPSGEFITRIPGFIPPDQFKMILRFLAEKWYEKMEFQEFQKREAEKSSG